MPVFDLHPPAVHNATRAERGRRISPSDLKVLRSALMSPFTQNTEAVAGCLQEVQEVKA